MKNLKKILYTLVILVLVGSTIAADGLDDVDANIKFTVEAVIPENQIDKDSTYFHLLVDKTHSQTIKVKAINLRKEPVSIKASANNATTNSHGVIEYGPDKNTYGQTNQNLDFESIVTVKTPILDLEAYEEKEFIFQIEMTDKTFDGVILGGLNFELNLDGVETSGISQTYSYGISTALSQNETYLKSSRTLDLLEVQPVVKDGFKFITFTLENQEPNILTDLKVDAKLYNEAGEEVLFQKEALNMEMAPHTKMDFGLDLGRKDIKSGTYRYVVVANSFKQEWRWENFLEIGEKEAEQVINESLNKVFIPDLLKYGVYISIILTLINAGLIINESRKKEEES